MQVIPADAGTALTHIKKCVLENDSPESDIKIIFSFPCSGEQDSKKVKWNVL